jgi:hypothetical protein
MSVGEDTFFDALQDDLDLEVTGVGPTYDEEDEEDDSKQQNDSDEGPSLPKGSFMAAYLKAIQGRLQKELSQKKGKVAVRTWLLQDLKKFNF